MEQNISYWKAIQKMLNQKCECGGVYLHKNKSSHEKTKKHKLYIFDKIKFNYD